MTDCPCACHANGAYPPPCDQPGGCGPHDEQTCALEQCGRWPAPGWLLCRGHGTRLGQWLADLEQLYATLDPTLSMGTDWNTSHGGGLASERAPARLDVLVLADPRSRERDLADVDGNHGRSVLEVLHAYAVEVREGRNLTGRDDVDVSSERSLLVAHFDWCLGQDFAAAMYGEVRQVWSLLKAAHGEHPPKPAATCWVPVDGGNLCGGPVWTDPGRAWCSRCGTSWTGLALLRIRPVLDGAA